MWLVHLLNVYIIHILSIEWTISKKYVLLVMIRNDHDVGLRDKRFSVWSPMSAVYL